MGLLDIVRSGVAIADKLTKDLQPTVQHEAFMFQGGRGDKTFAAAVPRQAIVEIKPRVIRTGDGRMITVRATITLLDATVTVTDKDRFTLPDGTTGPILERTGLIDRETGQPVLTQVFLG